MTNRRKCRHEHKYSKYKKCLSNKMMLICINDSHMEELDSVQKLIETQDWLLLTFFICLHSQ